ncbi:SDR family NAD(P)-dependent oxidoreductase [Lacticaseibacillus saniviri]
MTNTKIAIVAGGTSGVGKRTAIDLAKKQVHVIIIGSNPQKGEIALQEIKAEAPTAEVEFIQADLSRRQNINQLATQLSQRIDHIDILVTTMGGLFNHYQETADQLDLNIVINYWAHYWLITALEPLLTAAPQSRVLVVGALPTIVNHITPHLPELHPKVQDYNSNRVSTDTLLARVLMVCGLADHWQNSTITINLFHPGSVPDSSYGADSSWWFKALGEILARFSTKNSNVGSRLALEPAFAKQSGSFYDDKARLVPWNKKYTLALAQQLLAASA